MRRVGSSPIIRTRTKKGFSFGKILFCFQTDGRQTDGTKRASPKSLLHPVATSVAFIFSTLYICLSDEHHPFTFIALQKREQPQAAPFRRCRKVFFRTFSPAPGNGSSDTGERLVRHRGTKPSSVPGEEAHFLHNRFCFKKHRGLPVFSPIQRVFHRSLRHFPHEFQTITRHLHRFRLRSSRHRC